MSWTAQLVTGPCTDFSHPRVLCDCLPAVWQPVEQPKVDGLPAVEAVAEPRVVRLGERDHELARALQRVAHVHACRESQGPTCCDGQQVDACHVFQQTDISTRGIVGAKLGTSHAIMVCET